MDEEAGTLLGLAEKAIAAWSVPAGRITFLRHHSNHIFRVVAKDGAKYAMRITSPTECHRIDEVRSETVFLEFLRRHTDLGVPEPVRSRSGRLVSTVRMPGTGETRPCVLFKWIPGVELANRFSRATLRALGACTAKLHVQALDFRPPPRFRVRKLDRVFTYSDRRFPMVEPIVLFGADVRAGITPARQRMFLRAARLVQHRLDALFADRRGLRVIHNDLHGWNVRISRDRMYLIDFEGLSWGYPVQDIATTFNELPRDARRQGLIKAYIEGYTTVAPWPRQTDVYLTAMMAGRSLMLLNWRYANDRDDLGYQQLVAKQLTDYLGVRPSGT